MDDNRTNAPSSRAPGLAKILGTLAILALVIAIILLGTGAVNFEQGGWFGS